MNTFPSHSFATFLRREMTARPRERGHDDVRTREGLDAEERVEKVRRNARRMRTVTIASGVRDARQRGGGRGLNRDRGDGGAGNSDRDPMHAGRLIDTRCFVRAAGMRL